jgi:hypothetical protein
MKKSHRQSRFSVIQPPSAGPIVGAMVTIMPMSVLAMMRLSPENAVKAVENTHGIIAPPMKP